MIQRSYVTVSPSVANTHYEAYCDIPFNFECMKNPTLIFFPDMIMIRNLTIAASTPKYWKWTPP